MVIFAIIAVTWIVGYFYPLVALIGFSGLLLWIVATEYNNGTEGEKKIIMGVVMVIWGVFIVLTHSMPLDGLLFLISSSVVGWVVKKIEERYTPQPPTPPNQPPTP